MSAPVDWSDLETASFAIEGVQQTISALATSEMTLDIGYAMEIQADALQEALTVIKQYVTQVSAKARANARV
jgi:hypothetical protein